MKSSWNQIVLSHWKLKLLYATILHGWVAVLYYVPQVWLISSPTRIAPSWIDGWIQFQPSWAWIYQSVFIMMPLAFWTLSDKCELQRFLLSLMSASLVGAMCFLLYPTIIPRPAAHLYEQSWGYIFLITKIDGMGNVLPSLHAAFSVLSACTLSRTIARHQQTRQLEFGLGGWLLLLLYSTLATKQHFCLDIIAGVLLGAGIDRFIGQKAFTTNLEITKENQPQALCNS